MNFETANNVIRTEFESAITTAEALPTAWPNAEFDKPTDEEWARVQIIEGVSFQATIPAGFRNPGTLVVSLFTPVERGDAAVLALVDKVAAAFKARTVNGVTFRTPHPVRVGRDGSWYQINVVCPFYFEDK